MTEVNIDAQLVEDDGFSRTGSSFVELTNSCTLGEDLLIEVNPLLQQNKIRWYCY